MHPRPLQVAELLLYLVGPVLLVRAFVPGYKVAVMIGCGLAMVLAAVGLSGELRITWVLALGSCILAVWSPIVVLLDDPGSALRSAAILDLVMVSLVAVLLLQPEVRAYRVRWLR